jgi:lambda repressor-like predicted transcriptional regulator
MENLQKRYIRAAKIKAALHKRGLTYNSFGNKKIISQVVLGIRPSPMWRRRIAEALGTTVEKLWGNSKPRRAAQRRSKRNTERLAA